MKKILIPIDGTERSKQSLEFVSKIFPKDSVEITLMNVKELILSNTMALHQEMKIYESIANRMLIKSKEELKGYNVIVYFSYGYPGQEIIEKSAREKYDAIIMTKSTKKNFIDSIGSVTTHVVKKATCTVIIVPENNKFEMNESKGKYIKNTNNTNINKVNLTYN